LNKAYINIKNTNSQELFQKNLIFLNLRLDYWIFLVYNCKLLMMMGYYAPIIFLCHSIKNNYRAQYLSPNV